MPISERLSHLGSGVFARNDRRKVAYQAQRLAEPAAALPPLLDLSLGSTDLAPPPVSLEAIAAALPRPESASYCLHGATLPFREAVAAWAGRRFGVRVDPETEVLLLVGSQEGTAHLPLAVLDPGDAALLLDPYYPSHSGGLQLASATIERLRLDPARGWRPDFGAIPAGSWQALKLMVLGFPHNPTATTGEQAWLDEAVGLALSHDIVLAHDNPYLDLALEGEAPALLRNPAWRRCGIEFFSFSKGWCLGGFRIAFAIGAEPLISGPEAAQGRGGFQPVAGPAGRCHHRTRAGAGLARTAAAGLSRAARPHGGGAAAPGLDHAHPLHGAVPVVAPAGAGPGPRSCFGGLLRGAAGGHGCLPHPGQWLRAGR